MTLSMTSEIRASEIIDVKCFKQLKVYLLRGTDGSDIVIKIDAVGTEQLKNTGKVIKAIDPVAKMKMLTATERHELNEYCKNVEDLDKFFKDLATDIPDIVSPFAGQADAVAMLKQSLSFSDPFVKMIKQTIHNIEDIVTSRGTGSKDLMRQFVSGLKATGGLEKLGQIIAADLFNGNSDRFFPDRKKVVTIGPFKFNIRVTVNLGNIMMIVTANGLTATALDYADPNSTSKSYTNKMTDDQKKRWSGSVLAKTSLRHKFAEDVIHDLEQFFNPKKSAFSMRTKLGRDAVSRLEKGMKQGTRQIVAALSARPNNPVGLVDRLAIVASV